MPYCSKCGKREYYCTKCGQIESCDCGIGGISLYSFHKCNMGLSFISSLGSDKYCSKCGEAYPSKEHCRYCGMDITPSHVCRDSSGFSLPISLKSNHRCSERF